MANSIRVCSFTAIWRSKSDPLVEEVELLEVNPSFAKVRFRNRRHSNVPVSDLAPCPQVVSESTEPSPTTSQPHQQSKSSNSASLESSHDTLSKNKETITPAEKRLPIESSTSSEPLSLSTDVSCDNQPTLTENSSSPRRSGRVRRPPQRYGHNMYDK